MPFALIHGLADMDGSRAYTWNQASFGKLMNEAKHANYCWTNYRTKMRPRTFNFYKKRLPHFVDSHFDFALRGFATVELFVDRDGHF